MMELADIFRRHIGDYLKSYTPNPEQRKAINAILNCRTAHLGAHIDVCTECGVLEISYNSCNNRHCNKCQTVAKEKWLHARQEELINVGYFHTVFTVPSELNAIFYQNQKILYNILFKASNETVLTLCQKNLGGQPGITAVMHTWGQNLNYHPHIHQIIPGGVLTKDLKWRKSRDKFLLPVKIVGKVFSGKFLFYLKQAYDELKFFGIVKHLENPEEFARLIDSLYHKNWVIYSKAPFKSASHVLSYLGRYTHRVAISNNRILSCENGIVKFKWRNYKDGDKLKIMSLSAVEFIRRILMHVLPDRFMKIRHYGFLSNNQKQKRLRLAQKFTGSKLMPLVREKLTARDIMLKVAGIDICSCKHCGGTLNSYNSRAAPWVNNLIQISPSPSK